MTGGVDSMISCAKVTKRARTGQGSEVPHFLQRGVMVDAYQHQGFENKRVHNLIEDVLYTYLMNISLRTIWSASAATGCTELFQPVHYSSRELMEPSKTLSATSSQSQSVGLTVAPLVTLSFLRIAPQKVWSDTKHINPPQQRRQ